MRIGASVKFISNAYRTQKPVIIHSVRGCMPASSKSQLRFVYLFVPSSCLHNNAERCHNNIFLSFVSLTSNYVIPINFINLKLIQYYGVLLYRILSRGAYGNVYSNNNARGTLEWELKKK